MGYYYTKKEAEKAILVGVALQDEGISYDQMNIWMNWHFLQKRQVPKP